MHYEALVASILDTCEAQRLDNELLTLLVTHGQYSGKGFDPS
jgi:hypothetical protein